MKILNIAISIIILVAACAIGSAPTGGMGSLWDLISLAIVVIPSYFLVAASTNSYTFYKDKSSLLLFGDLAWGFGLIGEQLLDSSLLAQEWLYLPHKGLT